MSGLRRSCAWAGGLSLLALAPLLAGCGKADSDPGPGGVTMGEARALDKAAAMLDARRPPAAALQPSGQGLTPQDTPEPAATKQAVENRTAR